MGKVLLTPSCTHALELSALLLDIEPGDEVILPSFTFVSVANAFVLRGARPVFAEIRQDTLNLDEEDVGRLVNKRTRAIIAVHYAGVGCEMKRLGEVVAGRPIHLVEDNAHGLFGEYDGCQLGTFGDLATLSFHETKNFTCGEGGALLINDQSLSDRAEILREKGTDRSRFFRGEVDKYHWVDVGSSYLAPELSAAFLLGQLEARQEVQEGRRCLWNRYHQLLRDWAEEKGVGLPSVPRKCRPAYHLFYILCPSAALRRRLMAELKARGVSTVFHYVPLHSSPMGERLGYSARDLPVTEDLSARLLRLPFFNGMSEAQQDRVAEALIAATADW